MKLTKQQAIEGHRKMWNWIADEIEMKQIRFYISGLKKIIAEKTICFYVIDVFAASIVVILICTVGNVLLIG